ncbi:FAD-dependent oxidoreductase [candidate division KSB1 bacterium]|nr:FAD-dependent oxidoreductase [candidate division KSB1 bacterium]
MDRRQFIASSLSALAATGLKPGNATQLNEPSHPFHARQSDYHCDLLVVGASSAGTAAALTAGRLGLNTILVMRSPRELGGLETNGLNPDSDLLIRCIGGFSMELDVLGRVSTGLQIEDTKFVAPPHTVFRYILREFQRLSTVTIIADYFPDSVEKEGTRVSAVHFRHRKELNRTLRIFPEITIDAEIEGDVTFLAGASTTLKREGRISSDDPTQNCEAFAGELYTPGRGSLAGGDPLPQSSFKADAVPRTMGWSAIIVLEKHGTRSPENPWLLTLPPAGYKSEDYQWMRGIGGVKLGDNHYRCSMDEFSSLIEGWMLPDGRHVLESMNIADREFIERKHLARVLGALYHGQHVLGKTEWGLSSESFREGLPPKYTLADFGTSTRTGNAPLPSLIYMREGRRLVNEHVFGGKFMEDQGTAARYQKNYWHPRSFYFNAMNIDIHGVTNRFVEGSGPEGMQVPRFVNPKFGVCCIPFDVCIPRQSEATQLLVASAGAYTHEAYSAFPRMEPGRFQIGDACARAAFVALDDNVPPHEVNIEKVQLLGLYHSGHSIVYFDDALPGTETHVIDQMSGARGVPLYHSQGNWISEVEFTNRQALTCLENFFLVYSEQPLDKKQFATITRRLRDNPDERAKWGTLLPTISAIMNFHAGESFESLSGRWYSRGYLSHADSLSAETSLSFSQFKGLLFNIAYSMDYPGGAIPVETSKVFLCDSFNREDGSIIAPELGPRYLSSDNWLIQNALATPESTTADSFLWIPVNAENFIAECDIFLEQTQTSAFGGIGFKLDSAESYVRFALRTNKFNVIAAFENVREDSISVLSKKVLSTMLRGFTLRTTKSGHTWQCALRRESIFHLTLPNFSRCTHIGLFNGAGTANNFDNFRIFNN